MEYFALIVLQVQQENLLSHYLRSKIVLHNLDISIVNDSYLIELDDKVYLIVLALFKKDR